MKGRFEPLDKGGRLVQCGHCRVRIEHLFEQGCAAARVSAQKGQRRHRLALGRGKEAGPGAQSVLGQAPGELARALCALVVGPEERPGIRERPHNVFGLPQQLHGFIEAPRAVQHLGQFVAAGIADIRMPWLGGDEVAQAALGLFEPVLAAVQNGAEIARLVVLRINRQALLDRGAGLGQPMILLQQHCQADAGVDGAGPGCRRAGKAGPRLLRPAPGLVLVANQSNQFGIGGVQVHRSPPGALRQFLPLELRSGIAEFEPHHGRARAVPDQLLVEREGPGEVLGQQALARLLVPLLQLAGCHASCGGKGYSKSVPAGRR